MDKTTLLPPVIFLVYANDRIDPAQHLRNLKQEINGIRNALRSAEQAGLCEVVFEPNASADQVISLFQESSYRNRIAIFHYAGHANGYQLLLESPSGHHGTVHSEGLAEFLGLQSALQLVFLNGCSTEHQAQNLLDANCPAVITTSQAINDETAMDFAIRFYQGLGGGAGLVAAYNEAVAATKSKSPDGHSRTLYWDGTDAKEQITDHWPWALQIKSGNDSADKWSLPYAVGNDLFGLPLLPTFDLPSSPFRHLNWFERKHSGVFFGRGTQIRTLYLAATDEDAAPIILFYGQSGVGKSSVLDAGLLPRLEKSHSIHYLRRNQSLGLLGTLMTIFDDTEAIVSDVWYKAENDQGLPLLVVLDQAEEIFTRPNPEKPNELSDFVDALENLFGDPVRRPRGRLILSFRKEWLPEIDQRLEERDLRRNRIFIETINRPGIIEAITGPISTARLHQEYKLEIEDGLAKEIADDLLADRESPVAPTLQILLTKLWDKAREIDFDQPVFTRELYLNLKDDGILLGDFLDQQLELLDQWRPNIVKHGLALDLLAYHTTQKGTAAHRTTEDLSTHYGNNREQLPEIIEECKKGYLLADIPSKQREPISGTRLSHDTLAPLVRMRFEESDRRGQRARRILENRCQDWKNGDTGAVLDDTDYTIVKTGQAHMRDINSDEKRLINASQKAQKSRNRMKRLLQATGLIALIALFLFTWITYNQLQEIEGQNIEIDIQRKKAIKQQHIAEAKYDASEASAVAEYAPQRALKLAIRAVKNSQHELGDPLPETINVLRKLLAKTGGIPLPDSDNISGYTEDYKMQPFSFSPNGHWLTVGKIIDGVTFVYLWDTLHPEKMPHKLKNEKSLPITFAFDPKNRWFATISNKGIPHLWDLDNLNKPPELLPKYSGEAFALAFGPDGQQLATLNKSGPLIWNLDNLKNGPTEMNVGQEIDYSSLHKIAFDPTGQWLMTAITTIKGAVPRDLWNLSDLNEKSQAIPDYLALSECFLPMLATQKPGKLDNTWNLLKYSENYINKLFKDFQEEDDEVTGITCDRTGRWFFAAYKDHSFVIRDRNNPKIKPQLQYNFNNSNDNISGASLGFDPKSRWFIFIDKLNNVRRWDLENIGAEPLKLFGSAQNLTTLKFISDSRWLVGIGYSNAVFLWDMENPNLEPRILKGHSANAIYELINDPTGRWIATYSPMEGARLWDLKLLDQEPHVLPGKVKEIFNDQREQLLIDHGARWLVSIDTNKKVLLWDQNIKPTKRRHLLNDPGNINKIALDPQGRWLAVTTKDGKVLLWDLLNQNQPPKEPIGINKKAQSIKFDSQGQRLIIISGYGEPNSLNVWDLDPNHIGNQTETLVTAIEKLEIEDWAIDPMSRWIAIATKNFTSTQNSAGNIAYQTTTTVQRWNFKNLKNLPQEIFQTSERLDLNTLHFDTTARWVAASFNIKDKTLLKIWDINNLETPERNLEINDEYRFGLNYKFSSNGRWLITDLGSTLGYYWRVSDIWDLHTPTEGQKKLKIPSTSTNIILLTESMTFSTTGDWFAATIKDTEAQNNEIMLWDLNQFEIKSFSLKGHQKEITDIAFAPNGQWLASASEDKTVRLWSLKDPKSAPRILNHPLPVVNLYYDPKGHWLATTTNDGKVRLWELDTKKLLKKAERILGTQSSE